MRNLALPQSVEKVSVVALFLGLRGDVALSCIFYVPSYQ